MLKIRRRVTIGLFDFKIEKLASYYMKIFFDPNEVALALFFGFSGYRS